MSTIAKTHTLQSLNARSGQDVLPATLQNSAELLGRALLVGLFAAAGASKITAYAATQGYMTSQGVPGSLLPFVIATELLGSLAIVLGWHTRIVAFLMAGFTVLTALLFHTNFADQTQMIMFMKNISIAGALLMLVAHGAGVFSLDARRSK